MTTAFARVGFSGDYGGTYFMTQLVGAAKARELYFLSERVNAEEALRLGLVNWICAPEDLAARTHEIARRLASGPTVAYRYMKENLNRAMNRDVDDCLDPEQLWASPAPAHRPRNTGSRFSTKARLASR